MSYVVAHVFDHDWKLLSVQYCPTGYRAFITEAVVLRPKELGQDVIAIKTVGSSIEPALDGVRLGTGRRYSQMDYLAFVQGRLELIRFEDDQQQAIRNLYTTWKPLIGPSPPTLSTPEWIDRLTCGRPVEQLSALVWLTGEHMAFSAARPDLHACEPVQDSLKYELVRDSPRAREVLKKLSEADNPWVKEYAALGIASSKN